MRNARKPLARKGIRAGRTVSPITLSYGARGRYILLVPAEVPARHRRGLFPCRFRVRKTPAVTAFLGFFAAALSTCSLVPQVYRTLRTRSTGDLAWGYLVAMLAGGLAWLTYGIGTGDVAVIVANAVCSVLSAIIVGTKVRARIRPRATLTVVPDPAPEPEPVALVPAAEPAA